MNIKLMIKRVLKPIYLPYKHRVVDKIEEIDGKLNQLVALQKETQYKPSLLQNKLSPFDLGYYSRNHGPAINSCNLRNCKVLTNRYEALEYMPKNAICAEVGVAYGDFSQKIIQIMSPNELYLLDLYPGKPGEVEFWGETRFLESGLNHEEYIRNKFKNEKNVYIRKGYSDVLLESFKDDYFDYVYVDGGHDYETVKKDISVLKRKIKNGGIIAFNDYTFFALFENIEYGIFRAVNEFLEGSEHQVIFYCLHGGKMDDIVIKINK